MKVQDQGGRRRQMSGRQGEGREDDFTDVNTVKVITGPHGPHIHSLDTNLHVSHAYVY